MATVEITGKVSAVEMRSRPPYNQFANRYGTNRELSEFYLKVTLETEAGAVYFNTPAITRCVSVGAGCAVVVFDKPKGNRWFRVVQRDNAAGVGQVVGDSLESAISEGETITVRGSLKTETVSRKGNPYRVINRVKLTTPEPAAA